MLREDRSIQQKEATTLIISLDSIHFKIQVPIKWTINRLKVFITAAIIKKLHFDEFVLVYDDRLLNGWDLVTILCSQTNVPKKIKIVRTQSPIKYYQYYEKIISKVVNSQCIDNFHCGLQLPILHKEYSKTLQLLLGNDSVDFSIKRNQAVIQNLPEQAQLQAQGNGWFVWMQRFGIFLLAMQFMSTISFGGIIILLILWGIHYYIDKFVKMHRRNEGQTRQEQQQRQRQQIQKQMEGQQRQRQQQIIQEGQQQNQQHMEQQQQGHKLSRQQQQSQKKNTNKEQVQFKNQNIKPNRKESMDYKVPFSRILHAKMVLYGALCCQIVYCYCLLLFPNWTIETHLRANHNIIIRIDRYIKKLLTPQIYKQA